MSTDRRTFIRQGRGISRYCINWQPGFCSYQNKSGIVGLQLYSIRSEMAKDPLGSLKKLADMG
jgi:hypothetical protein